MGVLQDPMAVAVETDSPGIGVEVADRGSMYRSPSRRPRGCLTK